MYQFSTHICRILGLLAISFALMACQKSQVKKEQTLMTSEENAAWLEANLDRVMEKKSFQASNGLTMPYRLFVPENYDETRTYPLVVFLHGRGERGTDNTSKMFKTIGLFSGEHSIIAPNGQKKFPAIVIVPQCSDKTTHEEWAKWVGNSADRPFEGLGRDGSYVQHEKPSASGAAAIELIEATIKTFSVDADRVYLTGISMGGFGTWEFTSRRPDLFAAAVPMAGYSDPTKAEKVRHIPFWTFHGDIDKANPVEGSRIMTQRLRDLGAEAKYTEFEGLGHGESFEEAWKNAEILPWMFSKRRED